MEFTSPGDAGVHGPGLRVEVARRDYSYRQDVLPRMLEAQEADRPAQSQLMAVTLMDPPVTASSPGAA